MNKSELDHVWHSVTSVLENEFRTRGWLPPQAARIEALEAALREIAHGEDLEHETIGIALEHARSTAQAALASEQNK